VHLWGMSFLIATAAFVPVMTNIIVWDCRTSYGVSDVSLRSETRLFLGTAPVFWPRRPASECSWHWMLWFSVVYVLLFALFFNTVNTALVTRATFSFLCLLKFLCERYHGPHGDKNLKAHFGKFEIEWMSWSFAIVLNRSCLGLPGLSWDH
jgi:hypothetical protein